MFIPETNNSFLQLIKSFFSYPRSFFFYSKSYRNYPSVIFSVVRNQYPIKAVMKNGEKVLLKNNFDVFATARGKRHLYEIESDQKLSVIHKASNKKIILNYQYNFGGPYSSFLSDAYKVENIDDKIVFDIGAYVGDSSIFFALSGAKKVVSLEPLPQNYELAKKNIEVNNLTDKIDLFFAGLGRENEDIHVDPNVSSSPKVSLKKSSTGEKIRIFSLEKLLEMYDTNSAILKMNCEGCEYETILNSSKDLLNKFEYIMMEFHYGCKNLKKKLESCGFKVIVVDPVFCYNKFAENHRMYIGKIFASKNNSINIESIKQANLWE